MDHNDIKPSTMTTDNMLIDNRPPCEGWPATERRRSFKTEQDLLDALDEKQRGRRFDDFEPSAFGAMGWANLCATLADLPPARKA